MGVEQMVDLTEDKKMGVKQMVEVKNVCENNGNLTNGRSAKKKKNKKKKISAPLVNH